MGRPVSLNRPFKQWGIAAALITGLAAGLLLGIFFGLSHDLPQINQLKQFKPSSVTTLIDVQNRVISRFFLEKRFPVSIDAVDQKLITALLTTEDRNFYTHSGINPKAILRALILDLKSGKFKQGASTLTQQLAKTLFLSPEKSIVRKVREAILALQIERRYTKDEILELYLNQIYLGSGSYGVEAACRTYFNTSAGHLTLGQAALIAGLPKAPSTYSPIRDPEFAKKRRAVVLKQMLDLKKISPEQYTGACQEPVTRDAATPAVDPAPYFDEFVKARLSAMADYSRLHAKGANVRTSLDLELQKAAQKAIQVHMKDMEERLIKAGMDISCLECALIGIDTKTGGIRCMSGGRDYARSSFNRAVQALRQPGSAFKPLVYAAALKAGFSQTDILVDAPLSIELDNGAIWTVNNFTPSYAGKMTLRAALALSKNTPAVRLIQKIGPDAVVTFARQAGITAALKPYPSLALGSFEVTLMELTAAYIPFANNGIRATPFCVARIEDLDGRPLFTYREQKTKAMSRQDAAVMADMLKAVILEGTGKKAQCIKKEIAGKTGTTDDYKDALFVGLSPGLALGVWVGNDNGTPLGKYETGARAALPIWIDTMAAALENRPAQYFDIPDRTKMIYINPRSGEEVSPKDSSGVKVLVKLKD